MIGAAMSTQVLNTLGKKWWLVAAGEEGRAWDLFQAERCFAHDGAGLGDLRAFSTKREIEQAMARLDPTGQRPVNHALGSWQTLHVTVNAYERNPRARAACLAHYGFTCSGCGIRLEDPYGPIAEDFIHVQHLRSIAPQLSRDHPFDESTARY